MCVLCRVAVCGVVAAVNIVAEYQYNKNGPLAPGEIQRWALPGRKIPLVPVVDSSRGDIFLWQPIPSGRFPVMAGSRTEISRDFLSWPHTYRGKGSRGGRFPYKKNPVSSRGG